ncbi:MAG: hypothetical protein JWP35_101 [Caulobacter sp.]|nr:hypothetical protein [Caulobacter sp.]
MVKADLPTLPFESQDAFDAWLAGQPDDAPGLWVKFAKKDSGIASVSKAQAIEAALRYGWIDGQLDKLDDTWWLTRFTPRGPRSKWSQINVATAEKLIKAGRMTARGRRGVDAAKADGRWAAAYQPASKATIPDDLAQALAANPKAKAFFETLTGANRYAVLYRIGAVKKAETRARKIAEFVTMLEEHRTVHG